MMVNALTTIDTGDNSIKTNVTITNVTTGESIGTKGIWDTGATGSVITRSVAQSLHLKPISYTKVRGVHGENTVPVYNVKIILNNENISINARVTECVELSDKHDIGMLVGMNIIKMGDFSVSTYNGKTVMTFRVPSLETIDYVKEIAEYNKYFKIHQLNLAKHLPDKCPCESGKLYKNCHGMSPYNR